MTYIHVPVATSQNTQRLADDLQRVIEQHERDHPGLSKAEIDEALKIAGSATGVRKNQRIILAGVMSLLVGVGLLAYWLFRQS